MKKFLLILIAGIVLLGFVVPQIFLDKAYAMDRSATIAARPADIARVITDLNTWESWTVWNSDEDPTLEREFEGAPGQPGHGMSWTAKKLGNGSLTISTIEPLRIGYTMQMEGWDPSEGAFVMTANADGTTDVRWEMSGEITGFPAKRYFGLMMDGMVGPAFEDGLQSLKRKVEGPERPAGDIVPDAANDAAGSGGQD